MDKKISSFERKLSGQKLIKSNEERRRSIEAKMRRTVSDKSLLPVPNPKKQKGTESNSKNCNKILIIIDIFGSTGPIKFLVNGDDDTKIVIDKALKQYAREGRLPVLGFNGDDFELYISDNGFNGFAALKPGEKISSCGVRNFVLWPKSKQQNVTERIKTEIEIETRSMRRTRTMFYENKGNKLRSWFQKSFSLNSFKILSH